MFVVSSTAYGISQRLQAYDRMSDALARAAAAPSVETDKSQIFRVPGSDKRAAVSAVGVGKGVYVDAISQPAAQAPPTAQAPVAEQPPPAERSMPQPGVETAKAQLLAAMMENLDES